ncbi:MAG: hypothetical protein Q4F55_04515 [Bacillota bacterium]|nr:hypothetical protein [Bacillota bacterium]
MAYLNDKAFSEILKTVSIYPISSEKIGDVSRFSFQSKNGKEYEEFLEREAKNLDKLAISKTFLVIHNKTDELIAYFTLSADTVKLTQDERNDSDLANVKFQSLPAIKIGKLAVNKKLSKEVARKGYGSFVLDIANTYAYEVLKAGVACRFLTVDADIEYSQTTPDFYAKMDLKGIKHVNKNPLTKQ